MKKLIAVVGLGMLLGCGDGVSTDFVNPTATNCTIVVDGQGNIIGCGNISVTVIASPTPTPTASPTASPSAICLLPASLAKKCEVVKDVYMMQELANIQSTIVGPHASEAEYLTKVVDAVKRRGVCAMLGPSKDEVTVKKENGYSETYDVWNEKNFPQTLYVKTCTPAEF